MKIASQQRWVVGEARDAAIGVLKYYKVELPDASRNRSGNLTDSSEYTQLLQQPRGDSTADITYHNGLARFDSKYMSRIYAHISAIDDGCLYIGVFC